MPDKTPKRQVPAMIAAIAALEKWSLDCDGPQQAVGPAVEMYFTHSGIFASEE